MKEYNYNGHKSIIPCIYRVHVKQLNLTIDIYWADLLQAYVQDMKNNGFDCRVTVKRYL